MHEEREGGGGVAWGHFRRGKIHHISNFGARPSDTRGANFVRGKFRSTPNLWFLLDNQLCATLAGQKFEHYQLNRDQKKKARPRLALQTEGGNSSRKGSDEGPGGREGIPLVHSKGSLVVTWAHRVTLGCVQGLNPVPKQPPVLGGCMPQAYTAASKEKLSKKSGHFSTQTKAHKCSQQPTSHS